VQATRPYSAGASRLGRVDKSRALQGKAASPALGRAQGWAAAKQETARQGNDGCNTDTENKAPPAATATPTLGRAAGWGAAPRLGRALGWAAAAKPGHAQLLPYKLCVLVAEVVVELGVSVLAVVVVVAAVVGAATHCVWGSVASLVCSGFVSVWSGGQPGWVPGATRRGVLRSLALCCVRLGAWCQDGRTPPQPLQRTRRSQRPGQREEAWRQRTSAGVAAAGLGQA
jgi:hypothetical protein